MYEGAFCLPLPPPDHSPNCPASLIQPRMDHLCLHDMNSRNGTMIHAWWQIIDLKTHLVI